MAKELFNQPLGEPTDSNHFAFGLPATEGGGNITWLSLKNLLTTFFSSIFTKKTETFIGAGCYTLPTYNDNLDGTITIGNFSTLLYDNVNSIPPIAKYDIVGGLQNLTDQVTNYIVVDYNGGSPILSVITDVLLINESTVIPVFTIFRDGNTLHLQDWDRIGLGTTNKLHIKDVKTQRYTRDLAGGLLISEFGTRNLNVTGATVYRGVTPVILASLATDVDYIYEYTYSAGVWTKNILTQYNNTQFQDTNSVGTLGVNRYAVNWIFRGIENNKVLYNLLGGGDYTENQALNSSLPTNIPNIIRTNGYLIGRVIVQKSSNTATYIQSAFDTVFQGISTIYHNQFPDLQGGELGYYGHLTAQELLNLKNLGAPDYGFVVTDPDVKKTMSFDPATGLFSITGNLDYYRQGKFNSIGTTTRFLTLPTNANTEYYIYFDNDTATLEYSTTAWSLNSTKVFVAIVVFRTGTPNKYIILYECHTAQFPRQVHRYLHSTQGTKLISGGTISGITVNGTTDAQNTFGLSENVISDEDIRSTLNALVDGTGSGTDYTVMYRSGSIFTWETDQPVPFKYTVAGFINYDNAGTLTQSTTNEYINVFIFSVPTSSQTAKERFICLTGQAEHATADAAYLETWETINKTGFNFQEFTVLYQITYETNSGLTTKGKCRVNRVKQVTANSVVSGTSLSSVDWANITSIPTKLSDYYNNGNLTGVANILNINNSYIKGGILTEEVEYNKYEKILTNIAGNSSIIRNQTFYWTGTAYAADNSLFIGINAGLNNKLQLSVACGYQSGYGTSGTQNAFFGYNCGTSSTGSFNSFFGYAAGQSSITIYSNFSGLFSGNLSTGNYNIGVGAYSLYKTTGSNNYSSGFASGQYSIGSYCVFNGSNTGQHNNWDYRLLIGGQTGIYFNENAASTKNFADTDITSNTITIVSHGFGTIGTKVNLKFKIVSGATPTGLANNTIYQFTITSANVLTLSGIAANGTGSYSLTKDIDISNTIAIGVNVNPTKANQIVIGGTLYTETQLFGNILNQINKYNFLSTSQSADTIGDVKTSNQSGVYKIEYCSVANAVKGSGTWVEYFKILADGKPYFYLNGALKGIEVGAVDSGGTGYRLLRILN